MLIRLLLALLLVVSPLRAQDPPFARLVEQLSEGPGFFDSDNLVSNETSYLHVIGALRAAGVRRGAYLGVGPEQNFSYIAAIEPEIAFIVDIRRDNMLLHLLFKALFETARSRIEYLALLYGRNAQDARDARYAQDGRDATELLDYFIATPYDSAAHARQHQALMATVAKYGVPLSDDDRSTLRRFHDEFAVNGLQLTFTSRGRIARRNYPTAYRLYSERDIDSSQVSYVSSERRWQTVRALQLRNRIIPVVGDLAGPRAMRAIGRYLSATNRRVSAFYVSNVEMYLFRNGVFPAFVENVRALPAGPSSVIIRSWFNQRGWVPDMQPGHFSTQQLQRFSDFLDLAANPDSTNYWELMQRGLPLQAPARR